MTNKSKKSNFKGKENGTAPASEPPKKKAAKNKPVKEMIPTDVQGVSVNVPMWAVIDPKTGDKMLFSSPGEANAHCRIPTMVKALLKYRERLQKIEGAVSVKKTTEDGREIYEIDSKKRAARVGSFEDFSDLQEIIEIMDRIIDRHSHKFSE